MCLLATLVLGIAIRIITAARMFIECHQLQNRRFCVSGHPLIHYIKAVFGAIDTQICLFATCMAKKTN